MLQEVLKAFDGLLQVVVVAGIDDSLALDGIAFGKLLPQFINSIVPDDFGNIHWFARLSPPRVIGEEITAQFPVFFSFIEINRFLRDFKDEIVAEVLDSLLAGFVLF
jgi:hypothetical protein